MGMLMQQMLKRLTELDELLRIELEPVKNNALAIERLNLLEEICKGYDLMALANTANAYEMGYIGPMEFAGEVIATVLGPLYKNELPEDKVAEITRLNDYVGELLQELDKLKGGNIEYPRLEEK